MEPFKNLIFCEDIYPAGFRHHFASTSKHWSMMSWIERERDMRHDFCILLLCNLEGIGDGGISIMDDLLSRIDREKAAPIDEDVEMYVSDDDNDIGVDTDSEEEGDNFITEAFDDEDNQLELGEEPEAEEIEKKPDPIEIEMAERFIEKQVGYRYIPIEGFANEALLQNMLCDKMEIPRKRSMYDIVDLVDKKLIEVKVTVDPQGCINRFVNEGLKDEDTKLYIVNLNTNLSYFSEDNTELPGAPKVSDFLIRRGVEMQILQIADNQIFEEKTLKDIVFSCKRFNDEMQKFNNYCMEGIDGFIYNDIEEKLTIRTPADISMSKLFDLLADPRKIDGPIVTWGGKLTPHFLCDNLEATADDEESVDNFLYDLNYSERKIIHTGLVEYKWALDEILKKWFDQDRRGRNFNLLGKMSRHTENIDENLKLVLGIGYKPFVHNKSAEDVKQPDYFAIKPRKYHIWFDQIYRRYTEDFVGYDDYRISLPFINRAQPSDLYKRFASLTQNLFHVISKKNVGMAMSHNMNFYSRIGSTYLATSSGDSNHGSIAVIPLIINMRKHDELKSTMRIMTGVCVRAPHHARTATDRINLFFIERIKKEEIDLLKLMYKKITIVEGSDNTYFMLRQTAIKKIDCTHLSFVQNSLFSPTNLIGDMILNLRTSLSQEVVYNRMSYFNDNETAHGFFVDRVTDNLLMAIVANDRDEGYAAMARKILMILLNEKRNKGSCTWDLEEFCNKTNECLIDNPFSMKLQLSFKYCIAKLATSGLRNN